MLRRRFAMPMFVALAAALALVVPTTAEAARAKKPKPDYSVFITGDAQTAQPGGQAVYPVAVVPVGGFKSRITFEVYGLAPGVRWRVLNLGRNRYQLVLTAQPNVAAGSTVSLLAVRSGSKLHTAHFRLTVVAPAPAPVPTAPPPPPTVPPTAPPVAPVFNLRVDTPQATVTAAANQMAVFGVTVDRTLGYTGPVQFSISGLPAGAQANFAPNPTTQSTNLYVTVAASTPTGTYTLPIAAVAGQTVRSGYVTLVVQPVQTDFSLVLNPQSITVPAGAAGQYLVDVRPTIANQRVSLSVSGLPRDTSGRFGSTNTTGPTTLTLTTGRNTPGGTYTFTVTGRSGTITKTATAVLVVQNTVGFGLTATPATVVLPRTGQAPVTVSITRSGGFTGGVNLALAGLPAAVGYTASVTQNSATITFFSANAAPGVSIVTITGTNGALSASVQVQLIIQ